MSHRYWRSNLAARGVVIGIAAALAVGHAVAVAKLETSDHAERINSHAKTYKADLGEALIGWPIKAEPYEPNCQSPEGRDEADLCAQRRMAEAAEELTTLTRAQIIIGALGLLAILGTIILSIRATRAAEDQVRLTREALIKTERAFVFVEKIESQRLVDPKGNTSAWRFRVIWHNSGKTPAIRRISSTNSGAVAPGPVAADFTFEDVIGGVPPQRSATGPGGGSTSGPHDFRVETLQMVRAGLADAIMWGWTDYDDVFEGTPRHRTEYATHIIVVDDPAGEKCGFLYQQDERYTAFDDQCRRQPQPSKPLDPFED